MSKINFTKCDRCGVEIHPFSEETWKHCRITNHVRGMKISETVDLCENCTVDFLRFLTPVEVDVNARTE